MSVNVQSLLGNMVAQAEGDASASSGSNAAAAFGKKAGKLGLQGKKSLLGNASKATTGQFGEQLKKELANANEAKAPATEGVPDAESALGILTKHGDEVVFALSQRRQSNRSPDDSKGLGVKGNTSEKDAAQEDAKQPGLLSAAQQVPSLVDLTLEALSLSHAVKAIAEKSPATESHSKTSAKTQGNEGPSAVEAALSSAHSRNEPVSEPLSPPPVANTSGGSGVSEPAPEVKLFVASLPAFALEDASLRAALLPNVANLMVETTDAGALSVRLQVREGVTDIQLSGPAAAVVEARESELRVALASEGLALGNLDLTQRDSSSNTPREREDLPTRATWQTTATSANSSSSTLTAPSSDSESGRVHIKA